jgi:hypothetical protein
MLVCVHRAGDVAWVKGGVIADKLGRHGKTPRPADKPNCAIGDP